MLTHSNVRTRTHTRVLKHATGSLQLLYKLKKSRARRGESKTTWKYERRDKVYRTTNDLESFLQNLESETESVSKGPCIVKRFPVANPEAGIIRNSGTDSNEIGSK